MIVDGYARWAELNGELFLYRPYTRHDRERFEAEFARLPEHLAEQLEIKLVEKQIIHAGWGCRIADFSEDNYRTVATLVLGYGNDEQEVADETNLAECVRLRKEYPWLASTSCDSCRRWMWNPLTGELYRNVNDDGEREPIRRPEGYPLACDAGVCPKGHWTNPVELSEKNRLALQHYETSAGENDPIVNRNRWVIEHAEHYQGTHRKTDGRATGGSAVADKPGGDGLRGAGSGGAGGSGSGTNGGTAVADGEHSAVSGDDGAGAGGTGPGLLEWIGSWFRACRGTT